MIAIKDGRAELYQWDTGRVLTVPQDCSQVHFSNKIFGRSVDVDVENGEAAIPDVLLQIDKDLEVWAFVGTYSDGYTKISKTFHVNRRNKPAEYIFTPTEQKTIEDLLKEAKESADDAANSADKARESAQTASDILDRNKEIAVKTPYIGENGNWYVWDDDASAYVDSGAQSQGEKGNVMYATFDLNAVTGELTMYTPDEYTEPQFAINADGELEVVINA